MELIGLELDDLKEWDASKVLSTETLDSIYDIADGTDRERVKVLLTVHAKSLGIEKAFNKILKKYDKEDAELNRPVKIVPNYFYQDDRNQWRVSCPLLSKYIRDHEHYAFIENCGNRVANRYWYKDGCYRRVSDDQIKGIIKSYITKHIETALKMHDVNEVFQDLVTDNSFHKESDMDADESIINFENGLLNINTMQLLPHSPDILSTIQLPCAWNPDADDAPVFNQFMEQFTGGDPDKRELLLQYLGACLSNVKGYRFKKALFMVGAGNTGKSQLRDLAERLLGDENVCSVDLTDLENNRFAPALLLGKRLAGSSDTGFLPVEQMKIFKQLTGGDSIFMEFKGKDGFRAKYNGLLWYSMNDLPRFGGDRGEHVYKRIIIVRCNNVVPIEKQDKHLCDKMYKERESIVRMAVDALCRAISSGYCFAETGETQAERMLYAIENSPVLKFFTECCVIRDSGMPIKDEHTTGAIREAFKKWFSDNGHRALPPPQQFNEEIAGFLKCSVNEIQKRTNRGRYYIFRLTDEAVKSYSSW